MKSARDPRHQRRRTAVQELFASLFSEQEVGELTKEVTKNIELFDVQITLAAPAWPIDKLNKVDLAILRLATHELNFSDTPPKVVIDEAVELAKEFGSENSPSFVNGVLGNILKQVEEKKGKTDENN
jgi:N utilization substance protein B